MSDVRRILIVTGAGASTNLGADGEPMPMMREWASKLIGTLQYSAKVIGLTRGMYGPAFEAALGRFLLFAENLPSLAGLGRLGKSVTPSR